MDAQRTRQGIIFAFVAYFIWGIAPVYFKLIHQVPPPEILTHRVIWSFFFMLALLSLSRSWGDVRRVAKKPKTLLLLLATAVLIGSNWLIYIWAINNNHLLEASLDYLRPGRGEVFTASAKLIRAGNKVSVARVDLHSDSGVHIATANATYLVG